MSNCVGDAWGGAAVTSPRGYCSRNGSKLKEARVLSPQPRRRPSGKEGVGKGKEVHLSSLVLEITDRKVKEKAI